jgi:GT2 family glycosyltransferase
MVTASAKDVNLSILIVNWNTRDLLAQCLASINAYPPAGAYEVIVVDNGSTDGSIAMVRSTFPDVILIRNIENVGFSRANNQALRVARGGYALLLNSDTVVRPNTFQPLLNVMASQPQAGAVGPTILNPDETFQASYASFPTLLREFLELFGLAKYVWGPFYPSYGPESSRQTRAVDWVGGACLLVRRACWEQVGLLDESIVMYGEEVDWCYRMRQAGWQVVHCPEASVIHYGGQSSISTPTRKYLQLQQGRVTFFRKHRGRFATQFLIMSIRLSSLLKAGFCTVRLNGASHALEMREAYLAATRSHY